MDNSNNPSKRYRFVIFYKILHDTLFLLLAVFSAALLADGAIPGFFSSHLSFTKIIMLIFANISAIIFIARKAGLSATYREIKNNKLIIGLTIFSFLLIFNSLLKFNWLENIIITLVSFIILFYFYKILVQPDKKASF